MKTNPNDSAFLHNTRKAEGKTYDITLDGLTKREYFAAMALNGLMAGSKQVPENEPERVLGLVAVRMADALMNALNDTR